MKIALVHDYLAQDGGAERVLRALHEIWPEAPIFVLFHDQKKIGYFPPENIRESFLKKFPFIKSCFQWYLPWMPVATEHHDLNSFDVVISSSSGFAKGVITSPHTLHISYCHTPPRFLWADSHDYLSELKQGRLIRFFLPSLLHRLRLWDQMSTERVDKFIANSETVRQRIQKYYRRDSYIIHPPVNVHLYQPPNQVGDYFVAGGRLVPYKRLDLVVKTFNRLGWPLKIFGTGPELSRLKKISKPNIEFLGKVSEAEKIILLSHAKAFIHPQLEDFGITPIESLAAGRPVIAYSRGGATETISHNETGVFFSEQTWESLYTTLLKFNPEIWDSQKLHTESLRYHPDKFKHEILKYVNDSFEEFRHGWNQCKLKLP
ncbi:MAG: glycosyltransferase [bacterium]|nr:glycosyltransferase [bacterium]